jgi:hypothetical protein
VAAQLKSRSSIPLVSLPCGAASMAVEAPCGPSEPKCAAAHNHPTNLMAHLLDTRPAHPCTPAGAAHQQYLTSMPPAAAAGSSEIGGDGKGRRGQKGTPRGPRPRLYGRTQCQADGCKSDLAGLPRYHLRNHICLQHKTAESFLKQVCVSHACC